MYFLKSDGVIVLHCNTQGVFKLVIFKLYYIAVTDLIYLMIHVQTVTMPTMFEKKMDILTGASTLLL